MIRFRQVIDLVRHRLLFVPTVGALFAIALSQLMLQIDRNLGDDALPETLQTTVGSGRAILAAIAGGLISSVTLLLSLMLVAVQLASSQFSPRTVRNWIGDRTQQVSIAVVLGTSIYCLLVLRDIRGPDEGEVQLPHVSILAAVALGILSLMFVIRSVDRLTDRLRIGSVAAALMNETIAIIELDERLESYESPSLTPAALPTSAERITDPPPDAFAIEAPMAGWVQQIDLTTIVAATPRGSTIYIAVSVGSFTFPDSPVAWVWPAPEDEQRCSAEILKGFAFGDGRTMQQDIEFGVKQMVDIALRALSPGVNDPNTASDLIVHIGVTMLAIWQRPIAASVRSEDGRRVIRSDLQHGEYLHAAFDPIRLYGAQDPSVGATMVRTLLTLHSETIRRELPGPLEPIEEVLAQVLRTVGRSDLNEADKKSVTDLVPDTFRTEAS